MSQDDLPDLSGVIFPLRIILFALLMGVATLAGVAIWQVAMQGPMLVPADGLISIVLHVAAIPQLLLQFMVPGMVVNAARRRIRSLPEGADILHLLAAYRVRAIIAWALCESAAFMGLMAYLLEGNEIGLVIAAVAALLMLLHFPSASSLADWLQRQRDLLRDQRAMSSQAS